ncbi:exodeoxyribonuclease 7 large subunit [bacterium MnTg02]|nr:exodeoxyribonuclease 7 large subunit [bacterium MnTg02]
MTDPSEQTIPAGSNIVEFTVSELSFALKKCVEDTFSYVRVRGELGRISRPASGHIYLDLKDEKAVLAGVVWRGQAGRLKIQPEQGLEVIVTGRLTTYPGQSKYQIVIDSMEPAGIGALMALLEERKKKLAAEGLFDEERKKPIPFLPRVIGIVTSPSGAVIRDMLHGFDERFPSHILIWPVRVQGETCAQEVADAIEGFNSIGDRHALPRPDLLIVARGGGSLEDLWGFNEERVARAAAESAIPLISAVGHETDWTLIDLAADARAPTPTKAAEWAVPKRSDLIERTDDYSGRLRLAVRRALEARRSYLTAMSRALPQLSSILALPRQKFDMTAQRLGGVMRRILDDRRTSLSSLARSMPNLRNFVALRRQKFDGVANLARLALKQNADARCMAFDRIAERLLRVDVRKNLSLKAQTLSNFHQRALRAFENFARGQRGNLDAHAKLLFSLSYRSALSRGYALVRNSAGQTIREAMSVQTGDRLAIEFVDGRVAAETLSVTPLGNALKESQDAKRATHSGTKLPNAKKSDKDAGRSGGGQGHLF